MVRTVRTVYTRRPACFTRRIRSSLTAILCALVIQFSVRAFLSCLICIFGLCRFQICEAAPDDTKREWVLQKSPIRSSIVRHRADLIVTSPPQPNGEHCGRTACRQALQTHRPYRNPHHASSLLVRCRSTANVKSQKS